MGAQRTLMAGLKGGLRSRSSPSTVRRTLEPVEKSSGSQSIRRAPSMMAIGVLQR